MFVAADVRDADQAKALIDTTAARFGRVDVLVNNAGGSPAAPSADVSPRFVTSIVSLNLLAPFFCAQAANVVMQDQPAGGSIINIGSVSGARPSPLTAAYGAAKAGLVNLTESLAVEWAPKVRVNHVTAGLLDTGAGADHYGGPEGLAPGGRDDPDPADGHPRGHRRRVPLPGVAAGQFRHRWQPRDPRRRRVAGVPPGRSRLTAQLVILCRRTPTW